MPATYPSKDRAIELFDYNKGGFLIRKLRLSNSARVGARAGVNNGNGYSRVWADGSFVYVHRLVWIFHNGDIPAGSEIDHINGDRQDNRIENLRLATRAENRQNAGRQSNNSSGLTGVYKPKGYGKWIAKIKKGGKTKHIGVYETKEEAAAAYAKAKAEVHSFHPEAVMRDGYRSVGRG